MPPKVTDCFEFLSVALLFRIYFRLYIFDASVKQLLHHQINTNKICLKKLNEKEMQINQQQSKKNEKN